MKAYELGFAAGYGIEKEAGLGGAFRQWLTAPRQAFQNLRRGAGAAGKAVGTGVKNLQRGANAVFGKPKPIGIPKPVPIPTPNVPPTKQRPFVA